MPQSPQTHVDAISQLRKECQPASTPALKSSPGLNYPTRLRGSLWRAGIVIGILLILFISQGAAVPAAKAAAPTVVDLRTPLQSVLYTLRDAILQKDFDKYVSVYARNIRGNQMVRYWDRYDTLKKEVAIDKIEVIDPNNAVAMVTWRTKTKDLRTGKVSSDTDSERIMFTRKDGKWLILPDEDMP